MVRYFWSESNGTNRPTVRYMDFEPSTEYYNGMPLKKNEAGAVMPTTGDPEYICLWDYQPDGDIRTLEIPVIEIFPDTIYEKWNEDGTVEEVRFGSGGGGLPSDLVETVPDEVPLEITFDGNLEGLETTSMQGVNLVKVLDFALEYEQIVGGDFEYIDPDGNLVRLDSLTVDEVLDSASQGMPGFIMIQGSNGAPVMISSYADLSAMGFMLPVGVWFAYGEYEVKRFVNPNVMIPSGERTQIKPEFMPPHKHKWNDIEDQPFYDKSVSAPLNIAFDGDIGNYETVDMDGIFAVKVLNSVLTMDDLIGGSVVMTLNGEESETPLTNENVIDGMSIMGAPVLMAGTESVMVVYGDASAAGLPLSLGVWFMYQDENNYTKSLSNPNVTITTSETTPLPEKFIPELNQLTMISPSGKKFNVTVDDSGKLTAVEV